MSKTMEIGPYSAYAIAVKYGYTGSEEQWVKEQEANRIASEQARDDANDAAGRAETALQQIRTVRTDALDKISLAKTDALKALDAKQTSATGAVESAQGKALDAVTNAKNTGVKAVTDAQNTATQAVDANKNEAVEQVEAAKTDALKALDAKQTSATGAVESAQGKALDAVTNAKNTGVTAVTDAQDTATQAMGTVKANAIQQMEAAKTDALKALDAKQTSATSAVESAQGKALGAVTDAKNTATQAVQTEQASATTAVKKAGAEVLASIPEDYQTTVQKVKELDAQKAETDEAITAVKVRQNILIGTETGNPLSVDDAFPAPLCGLTVYGKSTQDGTPSPDNPVPIVSAGDGGSITLKVTGKNLYHAAWTGHYSENGLLFTATSTTITLKGTATKDILFTKWLVARDEPLPLDPNKKYTMSPKNTGVMIYAINEEGIGNYTGVYIPERSTGIGVYYQRDFKKDETVDLKISIQVELGTEATDYEPYHEQTLALQTPNGLPGIPVTSGGNYTDQSGQQWVCDEVDLERGVKVQRVKAVDLSTCTIADVYELAVTKRMSIKLSLMARNYRVGALCNRLPHKTSFSDDTLHFYVDRTNVFIFIPPDDKNPGEGEYFIFYALDTPIETPLTPAEIATYKALTAYGPDTVVQAGDGAGVKLEYQRDVNIAIKKLEDAVASMT